MTILEIFSGFVARLYLLSDTLSICSRLSSKRCRERFVRGGRSQSPLEAEANRFVDVNGDGQATPLDALLVINAISRFSGPFNLVISPTPDSDPNGNGVLLVNSVTLRGQTLRSASVHFSFTALDAELKTVGGSERTAEVIADDGGEFTLNAQLAFGLNRINVQATSVLGYQISTTLELTVGDVVADWNAALLNVVRDWTTTSDDPYEGRIVPSPPPIVARNLAMIHVAMFDALNSFVNEFTPYLTAELPDSGASPIAAAASAAYEVAKVVYPAPRELAALRATLAESLAQVDNVAELEKGVAFGKVVASAVLTARENDGSSLPSSYESGSLPGNWNRTGPDFLPPQLPFWGSVKPFAVEEVSDYRATNPPDLDSSEYRAAVDEVMRLGRVDSDERTADQTEMAVFWADGGGTATPPGHWNRIATELSLAKQQSTLQRSRTLALLNLALADAGISAWDTKYTYDYWRPIDAIREADVDGNDATVPDLTWQPLLRTPPHPTYTSGHSTFSGAGAAVLTSVFGENFAFASRSDGHTGLTQRPVTSTSTRHFENFWDAADEAGMSRIYGGIHFSFDKTSGQVAGEAIGRYVVSHWLRPRQE